nr:uncharacterized protein LOC121503124 [Drosophila kikkawai]
MSKEKLPAGRDDETQALAVARAEEELLRNFQRVKQKVQHSPLTTTTETHPMSAPPDVHGPVFVFGDKEEESATPKRSRDAVSPGGKSDGAKKQKVEASAQALVEKLGTMLDDMIAKFTDTKKQQQKEVIPDAHPERTTLCASQQTTPTLSGTKHADAPAGRPGNPAWQLVKAKPKPKYPQTRSETSVREEDRAPRTPKPRKQRSDAILIKCNEGSYADMLKIVKTEPSLQGLKNSVQGVRRTANGGLLLRMQKPLDPATQQLQAAIKTAISGKAEVTVMHETVQVEIHDLDDMTSGEEVTMALFAGEECDISGDSAPRMRKAFGGTQIATVNLRPEHARRLLEKGKIRIGWVVCRIRQKTEPKRCFKCMGFGHNAVRCRAPEATAKTTQDSCFKCGGTGHKHKTCHGKPIAAQDLLSQTATELKTDIAILNEPYRAKPDGVWQQSTDGGAAIWSCGQPAGHMTQRASRPGYTRAKIHEVTVYSCYLAPSMHIDAFREVVQEIAQDARGRSPVLIAGDFNAWSTAWGSSRTTQRGTILLDALATLNVCLLNDGNRCTYSKAGRESVIDLTFASPELTRNSQWEVTDLLTYSDHAAITFKTMHSQQRLPDRQTAYRVHTLNVEVLLASMDCNAIIGDANSCADALSARIKAACDAAMESSSRGCGRRPVPWWNQEIATARSECLSARRRCQRNRGRPLQGMYESIYRERKKALKVAIRASKNRCFQDLCDAADQEPFGSAYKMVMGKLIRQPTPTSHEQLGAIVTTLFPAQPPPSASQRDRGGTNPY